MKISHKALVQLLCANSQTAGLVYDDTRRPFVVADTGSAFGTWKLASREELVRLCEECGYDLGEVAGRLMEKEMK